MFNYQTAIYKAIYLDDQFGWDYSEVILFESRLYDDPGNAIMEMDFFEPPHPNWLATFRVIIAGQIIEEELFDASVYAVEYPDY